MKLFRNKAEKKAWSFFRKLVGDDEKFFSFKTQKNPMFLEGSDGGKYYLYPDGNLARIDKERPFVGRLHFGKQMPLADFLSSVYVWITKNEKLLKQHWGCGNMKIYYSQGEASYEDGQPIPPLTGIREFAGFSAVTLSVFDLSVFDGTVVLPFLNRT